MQHAGEDGARVAALDLEDAAREAEALARAPLPVRVQHRALDAHQQHVHGEVGVLREPLGICILCLKKEAESGVGCGVTTC